MTREARTAKSEPRLRLIRQCERRAIRAAQELVGFLVTDEPFGRSVELHRPPQTIRDISQVTQRRREVAFLERRPEVFRPARAHALDEVLEVRLAAVAFFVSSQHRTRFVLPAEEHLHLAVADLHPAL